MAQKTKQKPNSKKRTNRHSKPVLIGKTTLRRMLSAVYNESDPLNSRNYFSECAGASLRVDEYPCAGDEVVYMYYNKDEDTTIMTNLEGDVYGFAGSSAGFEGKVDLKNEDKTEKIAD